MKTWIVAAGLLSLQVLAQNTLPQEKLSSRVVSYSICVFLFSNQKNCSKLCTGLFLDGQTILTAAHCRNDDLKPKNFAKSLLISAHDAIISRKPHKVRNYTLHTNPEYDSVKNINDLMIIKIAGRRFTFSDPPPVVTDNKILDNTRQYLSEGFGVERRLQISGATKKFKYHKRSLAVVMLDDVQLPNDPELSEESSRQLKAKLRFKQVDEKTSPICQGDSGGPTYFLRPDATMEVLATISAFQVEETEKRKHCSSERVSVHTWLYPHWEWIQSMMQK